MYCIETTNVTHSFSKTEQVLNNIGIQVPTGSIYGFLGPNGAGKTTTLKLMLGLLKKQAGSISIFGRSIDEDRLEILRKVGSLVESPSLYAHLNARENLAVLQKIYQCPKSRIEEVLALVGLAGTGKKKAGKFSLGMKQRLSIAIAMLNSPSLLILDEPTNGLDPNGIIEMREFLKLINREQQLTILVSSHLLSEVEKLVTHVGIINKGNMMFQGTLPELLSRQQLNSYHVLDTSDNTKAMQLITAMGITVTANDDKISLPTATKEHMGIINQTLSQQGIQVYEAAMVKNDLETIFIDLIKN